MNINFYYNATCPHCFVVYQNMKQALHNIGLKPKINFVATSARGKNDAESQSIIKEYNIPLEFLDKRFNTDLVNQVMERTKKQQLWFEIVTEHYFYKGLNIESEEEIKKLLPLIGIDPSEMSEIKKIKVVDTKVDSTTLQIGEFNVEGVKDVSYYEFAFSCFYSEERETPIEFGECFCDGKHCE